MEDESEPDIRKTVALPSSWWREIEDFQFANRIKKDSVAVRLLIRHALDAVAKWAKLTKTGKR
jgi:hypothetical protein